MAEDAGVWTEWMRETPQAGAGDEPQLMLRGRERLCRAPGSRDAVDESYFYWGERVSFMVRERVLQGRKCSI